MKSKKIIATLSALTIMAVSGTSFAATLNNVTVDKLELKSNAPVTLQGTTKVEDLTVANGVNAKLDLQGTSKVEFIIANGTGAIAVKAATTAQVGSISGNVTPEPGTTLPPEDTKGPVVSDVEISGVSATAVQGVITDASSATPTITFTVNANDTYTGGKATLTEETKEFSVKSGDVDVDLDIELTTTPETVTEGTLQLTRSKTGQELIDLGTKTVTLTDKFGNVTTYTVKFI